MGPKPVSGAYVTRSRHVGEHHGGDRAVAVHVPTGQPGHLPRVPVAGREAREIHVDPTLHNRGQIAFKKLHEVGHDLCSWQRDPAYADDDETTSWSTSRCCEREANQAAAELMFQGTLMRDMAAQYEIRIPAILDLAGQIGSSGHAAFRRFTETHRHPVAGVVLDVSPSSRSPLAYRRREVVASPAWEERFGLVTAWPRFLLPVPYSFISWRPEAAVTRSLVRDTFRYPDLRSDQVDLNAELYSNTYSLFVLLWMPRRERFRHRRLLAA